MERSANSIAVYIENGEIVIDSGTELDGDMRAFVTADQVDQLVQWLREAQITLQGSKPTG